MGGCETQPNNNSLHLETSITTNHSNLKNENEQIITPNSRNHVNNLVYSGLKILKAKNPIKDIANYYGTPNEIKESIAQYNVEILRTTFYYPGLLISILQSPDSSKSLIEKVILSDAKYPVIFNLVIGSNKEYVINTLGVPNEINTDGSFTYMNNLGNNYVYIYFENDRIVKIIWLPYVD
jgi:hypothetical protein